MKIRIANNSIRFRLKQPEVEHFSHHKSITEELNLGSAVTEKLSFRLTTNNEDVFSITYSEQTVAVNIPFQVVQGWSLTNFVGIEEEIIA